MALGALQLDECFIVGAVLTQAAQNEAAEKTQRCVYRVADITIDVDRVKVSRDGNEISLPKLSFDLLIALVDIAPTVATTDYLLQRVWPGLVVNAETVTQRVRLLRGALGDDPKQPRYISVVRGRGYQVIPAVTRIEADGNHIEPSVVVPIEPSLPSSQEDERFAVEMASRLARFRRLRAMLIFCTLGLTVAVVLSFTRGSVGLPVKPSPPKQAVGPAQTLPARNVAVLPFESLGSNGTNDAFLASGFAESVIHALAGTPQITVIARRSSFAFKGRNIDVREIGRRLNARYLLEGSLQRDERVIRVKVELIDAQAGLAIWSAAFDRPLSGLMALQDELADKVAHALPVTMNAGPDERQRPPGTANLDAYLEYLRGRELAQSYRASDLDAATAHYSRAIEEDPNFSSAYSGLAWAKYQMLEFHVTDTSESDAKRLQTEVRQDSQKALALDSRNADAWQALAAVEDDPDRAELDGRRAVTLEPNLARAQFGLSRTVLSIAWDKAPERIDEVISLVEKAMQLDPLDPRYPVALAEIYFFHRSTEIEKVGPLVKRALELDPNYLPALQVLAEQHFIVDHELAEAVKAGERALALDPSSTVVRSLLINSYLSIRDFDAAERLLEQSPDNKSDWISIYAYRHEWRKAADIMYDEHLRAILPSGADWVVGRFAMRMDSLSEHPSPQAAKSIEAMAEVHWTTDGVPSAPVPMWPDTSAIIALADLAQRGGDPRRSRSLLDLALNLMDTAATKYRRGDFWFSLQRSRALALLGRTEDSFKALALIPEGGEGINWWEVEVDPAFDAMRDDTRFRQFVAAQVAHLAAERSRVDEMRTAAIIPTRRP